MKFDVLYVTQTSNYEHNHALKSINSILYVLGTQLRFVTIKTYTNIAAKDKLKKK